MQFVIGDKIVHPHHGPGRITGIERKGLLEEPKQYYIIEIPGQGLIVHIPHQNIDTSGVRPAMAPAALRRVLKTLRSRPQQLPEDYKERQELVWEKLKTGQPLQIAETVRDLTWYQRHAHLTKKDTDYLDRGRSLLAAEMALVSDTEVSEATKMIEANLTATEATAAD
jgi:CarD family transcriptional regulator